MAKGFLYPGSGETTCPETTVASAGSATSVAEQSDGYVRGFVRREKDELTRCPHLSVGTANAGAGRE
jgi:hypothetical protein